MSYYFYIVVFYTAPFLDQIFLLMLQILNRRFYDFIIPLTMRRRRIRVSPDRSFLLRNLWANFNADSALNLYQVISRPVLPLNMHRMIS